MLKKDLKVKEIGLLPAMFPGKTGINFNEYCES